MRLLLKQRLYAVEGIDGLDIHQTYYTRLLPEHRAEKPCLRFNLFCLMHAQLSSLFSKLCVIKAFAITERGCLRPALNPYLAGWVTARSSLSSTSAD